MWIVYHSPQCQNNRSYVVTSISKNIQQYRNASSYSVDIFGPVYTSPQRSRMYLLSCVTKIAPPTYPREIGVLSPQRRLFFPFLTNNTQCHISPSYSIYLKSNLWWVNSNACRYEKLLNDYELYIYGTSICPSLSLQINWYLAVIAHKKIQR